MTRVDNVVLGAGIAGIAAAYDAEMRGLPATVFEARSTAGGLLDNFEVQGFRFDQAVHLSFATEPVVRRIFDQVPYRTHAPESLCWDNGMWLRHPVQSNLYPLPMSEKVELIAGLAERPIAPIENYRDWLIQQYGEPIAKRWPLAYTEKYWTVPAEMLGTDWVGSRMRAADLREVLTGAFTAEMPNLYYAREMRYPVEGGYRSFLNPMLKHVRIEYERQACGLDLALRSVRFRDGSSVHFRKLVSTLPLPVLIDLIDDVPNDVRQAAGALFATEVDLISVGFNKPSVSPSLWFYIYGQDMLAARAYSPDMKSSDNVPAGCSSLQFEIYSSRHKPLRATVGELKRDTVAGLVRMGLATPEEILFVHHHKLAYGNVVFDLGMERRRDLVRHWVESQGIFVAGRFGEWAYLWSNQALLSGMRAAQEAFTGS